MKEVPYESLKLSNDKLFATYQEDFKRVMESGWYVLGKSVSEFEANFAKYCGTTYCSGVASGLDALIISLEACGFEKGKEVIVPSNTYIATILAILRNGLKPVLVEPKLETYNIDPKKIKEKVNENTVAIMVVHLYGKLCHMNEINEIAKENNLKVIEDCAQAHGASYEGVKAGNFGDFGAFSFYPTKNLGALGDGGAITTSSKEYDAYSRMSRNYGSEKKYYNKIVGHNSRLDELQAALLNSKLNVLDDITNHKIKLADMYFDKLKSDFVLPVKEVGYKDVFHIFCIRHNKRDELKAYLKTHGIGTEIHYPLAPYKQEAMKLHINPEEKFPIADEIHDTVLSLPISYAHNESDIEYVIKHLNAF
jgi:dTDP-4-amino-4,6-dideoxygalactose transaminase